jgi:hypothetical protein
MAKEQTGISGEFWFFSQLQRLGYKAYITLGNTKSVDISLQLSTDSILTFDVKTKANFGGSFQYLNIRKAENHYYVFVNLATKKINEKILFTDNPSCYIIHSSHIDNIAFQWGNKKSEYGFEAKLLWYLKFKDKKSITENNILHFKQRHQINNEIDFDFFTKIILTLDDFETKFHEQK